MNGLRNVICSDVIEDSDERLRFCVTEAFEEDRQIDSQNDSRANFLAATEPEESSNDRKFNSLPYGIFKHKNKRKGSFEHVEYASPIKKIFLEEEVK